MTDKNKENFMDICKLTVVTPTYNRAHTLDRVYKSLLNSTYKDFIWLIIDDGSTDNTEEKIKQFRNDAPFKIEYVKKLNTGQKDSLNVSYKYITTPYVINIDSDDEILPDGLMKIMLAWESIPHDKYPKIWCVTGRCIDSQTKEMVGQPFPDRINQLEGKELRKIIYSISGEKHSCRKTEIVKRFPFPTFSDTKNIISNMSWMRIDAQYDQWCINDSISIYYQDSPDSLAKSTSNARRLGYYYYSVMMINEFFDQISYNRDVVSSFINISRCGWRGGKTTLEIISSINGFARKMIVILCMPISLLSNIYTEIIRKKWRSYK